MNQSSMRVLFLAAEAEPLIKVGGLGDVAGSLPVALRNIPDSNIDIRLAIPFHGMISRQGRVIERIATTNVAHGNGSIPAEIFSTTINKLPVYLIAGGPFSPDAPVYSANIDVDAYKYTFFSLAALNIGRELNWQPHLIHANDWHTSPAIYALARMRSSDPFYRFTSGLLGVHNLPYGGVGSGPALGSFGLPPADNSPLPEWAQHMALPLGLLSADHIVAVSPTYAKEILTPEFGSGLHDFLRSRASSITGILNGLDPTSWNPETDPALTTNYSVRNLSLRLDNKIALQKEIGLEIDATTPLMAMIARMDYQKGVDLAVEALRLFFSTRDLDQKSQMIFLGSGLPELESATHLLQQDFPNQVRVLIRYDPGLSRRIYSGADMLLMPSRYEPCGLSQMIAMRYGCVPIVHATGGLIDTVENHSYMQPGTGFLFSPPTPGALLTAFQEALQVVQTPEWQAIQKKGMTVDFSWDRSARQYRDLYEAVYNNRIASLTNQSSPERRIER